jgi:hypothetical protein
VKRTLWPSSSTAAFVWTEFFLFQQATWWLDSSPWILQKVIQHQAWLSRIFTGSVVNIWTSLRYLGWCWICNLKSQQHNEGNQCSKEEGKPHQMLTQFRFFLDEFWC